MNQYAEDPASEGHEAGTDADLTFEGDRATTADDGQSGLIPCESTAFDVDSVQAAGGLKFFAGLSTAAAGAADDVDGFGARVQCEHFTGVEGFQREVECGGSVDFAEFGGGPHIDEPDLLSVLDGIVQFFGSDGWDVHVLISLTNF